MTVSKVSGTKRPMDIMMPTHDQLVKTYGSIARNAVKNGSAKALKNAPKNFAKYPSYDVTPKGQLGVDEKVYCIKGKLYMASTVVAPNAKTHWMDCGPAPLF